MTKYESVIKVFCEDCPDHTQFTARSEREAAKVARTAGWHVKGERALCPKHKQIQSAFRRHEHAR